MASRFLPCLVALASVPLVACYPYPEDPPYQPRPAARPQAHQVPVTGVAQPTPLASVPVPAKPASAPTVQHETPNTSPPSVPPPPPKPLVKDPAPASPKPDLPTAAKAPGKDGYVLSPYNQKLILVRGIPSGTVVPDPATPASDRKYFRVP